MPRLPRPTAILLGGMALTLVACSGENKESASQERVPVRAQIVSASQHVPSVALTGEIKARIQSDLSFRFTGRIAERHVDVGDHVAAGQVLATLEARLQSADVASATASVESGEATLRQVTAAYERQKTLLANGFTTQTSHDNALRALESARATLEAARSNLATAKEQLAYTALTADASGVVTARNAEAGQVVEAAQSIFTVARDGARDAVFEVYEGLLAQPPPDDTIELALISNPSVRATGKIREVAPAIDPSTGTVRVKISVDSPPAAMTLGAAVTGVGRLQPHSVFRLPSSAFFAENGAPAVWTIDPRSHAAAVQPIVVDSYRTGEILVRSGLKAGDIVVTAGVQLLRPGQIVTPLMSGAQARKEGAQ